MHFAPLTSQLRRELHVGQDVQGVVVTDVDRGSAADALGLSRGDVVVSINQQPVKNPQEAAAKLQGDRQVAREERAPAAQPAWRDAICRARLGNNEG